MRLVLLALLGTACVGKPTPDDSCTPETLFRDQDGDRYGYDGDSVVACARDGYVALGGDCDDAAPDVNPAAAELCGGLDEDCDGLVDEEDAAPTAWYADIDGDGYGDADDTLQSCEAPEGFIAIGEDCDDTDPEVNPDGEETCNGVDDNCDGVVDTDSATGVEPWHTDADGDGYGDPSSVELACDAGADQVADATDCDDTNADIHPDAVEVCNELDDDCDGSPDDDAPEAPAWYGDADGDGYGNPDAPVYACNEPGGRVADATDCDDSDSGASPAEAETCNGKDDDCDGSVDEADAIDVVAWYLDSDGDTHGDASVVIWGCSAPGSYVSSSDDCDDGRFVVHPGAAERCDAADIDEDCDGLSDDADPDARGLASWHADSDGDTYGDIDVYIDACEAPDGYLANSRATDCDDADPSINPGEDEVCDGLDDDCDGAVDDADTDVVGAPDWYEDLDGDTFGDAPLGATCDAPPSASAVDGDCDDLDATLSPDATEICGDGVDQDCDGEDPVCSLLGRYSPADADVLLTGAARDDRAPRTMAGGGDLDGDGNDDVLLTVETTVYVAFGPLGSGSMGAITAASTEEEVGDQYGSTTAIGGDLDGDGRSDWAVGARYSDRRAIDSGAVYLFNGAPAATTESADIGAAQVLVGEEDSGAFGFSVAFLPEQGGDGLASVLVGAYREGSLRGAAYVFTGPYTDSAERSSSEAAGVLVGEAAGDRFGWTVADGGDLDGDGLSDLVVGAIAHDGAAANIGAVYVYFAAPSGSASASNFDARLLGDALDDGLGAAISRAGDVDGDGLDDLLLGAENVDTGGASAGAVWLVSGGISGSHAISSAATAHICGETSGDGVGAAVAHAGDVDGDTYADLYLGAPGLDVAGANAGAAALFYGPLVGSHAFASADALFFGGAAGDHAGEALAGAGDTDADGYTDLLLGAPYDDTAASNAGSVLVWYGETR